mmetsp:Transcript_12890/g.32506  ORF Transcript_12890/g.32506 Transcript_12890/m.32506 type:complete len:236 (-) Transcript_12890:108-815(-)
MQVLTTFSSPSITLRQSTEPSSIKNMHSPSSPCLMSRWPASTCFSLKARVTVSISSASKAENKKLGSKAFAMRAFCSAVFSYTGGLKSDFLFQSPYASAETLWRGPLFMPLGGSGMTSTTSSSSSSSSSEFSSAFVERSDLPSHLGLIISALPLEYAKASSLVFSSFNLLISARTASISSPGLAPARSWPSKLLVCSQSHFSMKKAGSSGLSRSTAVTRASSIGFTFSCMYSKWS